MLAIGGLDTCILKSATLCSSPAAWPLAPMLFQVCHVVLARIQSSLARCQSLATGAATALLERQLCCCGPGFDCF